MKDPALTPVTNPITEARRYVANAKQSLHDHGQLDTKSKVYEDRKYVRSAGHFLFLAVLIALDAVFHVGDPKTYGTKKSRVGIDDYRKAVAQRDRKLLLLLNQAYDILHLSMGYDGVQSKDVCDAGFRLANDIIDRCSLLIPSNVA